MSMFMVMVMVVVWLWFWYGRVIIEVPAMVLFYILWQHFAPISVPHVGNCSIMFTCVAAFLSIIIGHSFLLYSIHFLEYYLVVFSIVSNYLLENRIPVSLI